MAPGLQWRQLHRSWRREGVTGSSKGHEGEKEWPEAAVDGGEQWPEEGEDLHLTASDKFINSFINSGYFYSVSWSPLLLRGALGTARILYRSFTRKRHRQLRVKDFPKVPTWRLERDSNPRPSGRQVSTTNASYMPHNAFSLSLNRLGILIIGHSLLSTASC